MARKRLNDTEALARPAQPAGSDYSICVRPISNGFVTRQTAYNGRTGQCESSEVFTKKEPRIAPPRVAAVQPQRSPLADTKEYLGKDV